MTLESLNDKQSISFASELFHQNDVRFRRVRFDVKIDGGSFKHVARMHTETVVDHHRVLSSWTLYGSLRSMAACNVDDVLARLPVVSCDIHHTSIRLGSSVHAFCELGDEKRVASTYLGDYDFSYFGVKAKRGYARLFGHNLHPIVATLSALSNRLEVGNDDWLISLTSLDAVTSADPLPLILPADACAMFGTPRRRKITLQ